MAEIISFEKVQNAKQALEGGWNFLACATCEPDPDAPAPGFVPLICPDAKGGFVAALICLGCERMFKLNCGRLS